MNRRLTYRQPSAPQPGEIEAFLASGAGDRLAEALVGLVLESTDLDYAYGIVTRSEIVNHRDPGVRGIAVLCLGHLARIHRRIPEEPTVSLIEKAFDDEHAFVRGHAHSAVSDVQMFAPSVGEKIQRPSTID